MVTTSISAPLRETRTLLLVVGPPRSGTSALRLALNQHPEMSVMGEILPVSALNPLKGRHREAGNMDDEALFRLRLSDPLGYVDSCLAANDRAVTGFKMIYPQMLSIDFFAAVQDLLASPNLRVITTWRRDMPARFRSQMLKLLAARGNYVERLEPHLSVDHAVTDCRNQIAMARTVGAMLDGIPRIGVTQEDLSADPQGTLGRLQRFLGVEQRPIAPGARPRTEPTALSARLDEMLADPALDAYRNVEDPGLPALDRAVA